jgi:hypothetical protein
MTTQTDQTDWNNRELPKIGADGQYLSGSFANIFHEWCGMGFEFPTGEQALACAQAIKKQFDMESTYRNYQVEGEPRTIGLEVERPYWRLSREQRIEGGQEWDAAWAIEPHIVALVESMGGTFQGT